MKFSFIVDEDKKALEFLSERVMGVSLSALRQLIKKREVRVNGSRISENIMLHADEVVEIFVPSAFLRERVERVYEDENVVVVDKPAFTSIDALLEFLRQGKGDCYRAVHRLDTNTRGLVVVAKNAEAEQILLDAFRERRVQKKYCAIVSGVPRVGRYSAFLLKDEKRGISYISEEKRGGYKEIITEINEVKRLREEESLAFTWDGGSSPLKKEEGCLLSKIEITIKTGRMHQIRAHLSHLGNPILGDDKYGNHALNKLLGCNIQQLTAISLQFFQLPAPLENLNNREFVRETLQKK